MSVTRFVAVAALLAAVLWGLLELVERYPTALPVPAEDSSGA